MLAADLLAFEFLPGLFNLLVREADGFLEAFDFVADEGLGNADLGKALDLAGVDLDGLAGAFAAPDVTAFLLCSPHNPTGTVHTAEELTAVAELCTAHGVQLVAALNPSSCPLVYPASYPARYDIAHPSVS